MLIVKLTLARITVGSVTMGGMLPARPHPVSTGAKTEPRFCRQLTIDLGQSLMLHLGVQSPQAQVRAARSYGVVDTLDAAFTGSPQLLHRSRTEALQQALSGHVLQCNQWGW